MTPINEALQSARSIGDWGFVLVIVFVGAGVFCTIAEKLSRQQSSQSLWKALQTISGVLVIGALAMEYWGHKRETGILDSGNAALQKQAEEARLSSLAMAVRVENLRKTNNELEEARLPMNIGLSSAFQESLKDGPPTPVFITRGIGDNKGKQTAEQLRLGFNTAGWRVVDNYETNEYGPGIILKANPGQSEKALHVLLRAFLDRNIPARIMVAENRNIFPINAIYIFVGERPHPSIAAGLVSSGRKREALYALNAYVTDHPNMTPNELAEANKLGDEVLKAYAEQIKEVLKVAKRDGVTNEISRVNLAPYWSVDVSNGIPMEYVSWSNTIPLTPTAISNWNKLVENSIANPN